MITEEESYLPEHRLFPHERWAAVRFRRQQFASTAPGSVRMQQNYGPHGVAYLGAAYADTLLGGAIAIAGIGTLIGAWGHGILVVVGFSALFIGAMIDLFGLFRWAQCVRTGRRFRGSRPFVKRT